MINKIVVLAAGKGTRMLNYSKNQPKHLINIGDKPFLYYHFNNLKQAGFSEIIVVVGYKKEKMEEFAKQYGNEFNLKLINQYEKIGTKKYGTACPVEAVKDIIGEENFIVVNGDDLFAINDLKEIKKLNDNFCYASGLKDNHPEYYGIFKMQNNYLKKIIEKPKPNIDFDAKQPKKYLINAGLYKFTPEIFKAIKNIKKSSRGEYELTDAISILAQKQKVKIFPIINHRLTFSNPDDIKKMEKFLLK